MLALETPDHVINNAQASGPRENSTNIDDQYTLVNEESIFSPLNTTHPYGNISHPNATSVPLCSSTHKVELQSLLNEMEDLIRIILGMPAPIKNISINTCADSPFADSITLVKMPYKFSFPNMKLYNGTFNLDDHIAQYK